MQSRAETYPLLQMVKSLTREVLEVKLHLVPRQHLPAIEDMSGRDLHLSHVVGQILLGALMASLHDVSLWIVETPATQILGFDTVQIFSLVEI